MAISCPSVSHSSYVPVPFWTMAQRSQRRTRFENSWRSWELSNFLRETWEFHQNLEFNWINKKCDLIIKNEELTKKNGEFSNKHVNLASKNGNFTKNKGHFIRNRCEFHQEKGRLNQQKKGLLLKIPKWWPQTVCPHWGVLRVGAKGPGLDQGAPSDLWPFRCTFA